MIIRDWAAGAFVSLSGRRLHNTGLTGERTFEVFLKVALAVFLSARQLSLTGWDARDKEVVPLPAASVRKLASSVF